MDTNPPLRPDEQPAEPDNSVMDSIMPPVKPRHLLAAILKPLLIVIIVAALAGGGIWFFAHHTSKPAPTTGKATTNSSTAATGSSVTKITAATKHYDSSNYNLGFDYPSDWTINDEATAKLTATSPPVQLRTDNDQTFTGEIIFSIQNQQTSIPEFAKNTAVAALQSQKISYKKPTPNQRAQTYVTFVNYSGSAAYIDALYITGDNGYQAAQNVPQSDVVQANPLVSVSFVKCPDAACKSTNTAAPILMKAWNDSSLSKPILALLESLAIE